MAFFCSLIVVSENNTFYLLSPLTLTNLIGDEISSTSVIVTLGNDGDFDSSYLTLDIIVGLCSVNAYYLALIASSTPLCSVNAAEARLGEANILLFTSQASVVKGGIILFIDGDCYSIVCTPLFISTVIGTIDCIEGDM